MVTVFTCSGFGNGKLSVSSHKAIASDVSCALMHSFKSRNNDLVNLEFHLKTSFPSSGLFSFAHHIPPIERLLFYPEA